MSTQDPGAPARGGWGRRLVALLVVAPLASLLLLEVVARVAPVKAFDPDVLDPGRKIEEASNRPHPYLSYALRPSWTNRAGSPRQVSHNSIGFRGPEVTWEKPEGRFRILCLGGSSTYGHTPSSDAATWPARLQAHLETARPELDVEVVNCGDSGWSTFESLANLAFRGVELRPDLVLVYHSINDMRAALYQNPVHPGAQPLPDNTHWRNSWKQERPSSIEAALERSRAYQVLRRYLTDFAAGRDNLYRYVVVDYDPMAAELFAVAEPSPQGFANFQRNLVSIVALARAHGARVAFATQGNDWSDFAGNSQLSIDAQKDGMARMTETLRRVGAERHVLVVEAQGALEEESARRRAEGGEEIFTHEVHLTDSGADLLAQVWARELLRTGLVP
jgi:hypothetical protein